MRRIILQLFGRTPAAAPVAMLLLALPPAVKAGCAATNGARARSGWYAAWNSAGDWS